MLKVKRVNFSKYAVVQIYLSENESKNVEINNAINEIKQKNKNVVIFVSGEEDIKTTLQYIINKQSSFYKDWRR